MSENTELDNITALIFDTLLSNDFCKNPRKRISSLVAAIITAPNVNSRKEPTVSTLNDSMALLRYSSKNGGRGNNRENRISSSYINGCKEKPIRITNIIVPSGGFDNRKDLWKSYSLARTNNRAGRIIMDSPMISAIHFEVSIPKKGTSNTPIIAAVANAVIMPSMVIHRAEFFSGVILKSIINP